MTEFEENYELEKYIEFFKKNKSFPEDETFDLKGKNKDIDTLGEFFCFVEKLDTQGLETLKLCFKNNESILNFLNEKLSGIKTNISSAKEQIVAETIGEFSFYKYLIKKIKEKGFSSEAAFYNYIGMSRQTFGKLKKKNASISRNHALLMAVGLELGYSEAVEFMSFAGYVFRRSNLREQIIAHVMKTRKYDLMLMEEILMIFGQQPLTDI